ncbi:MAG: endonuclease/exonuclease/phosphatase family protein [Vicinamibacterales bacterium]
MKTASGFILGCVILGMGVSVVTARQDGVPSGQQATRPARVPPELSDVLVHSPLDGCSPVASVGPNTRERLRIATWNIRAALSAPVDAIAAEVATMQADIVALQEVDLRTRRSGFVDEPATLATALGFHYAFAASIKWDEGDYGLAILSRFPLTDVRRHRLDATTATEPRIVLQATVCAGKRPLHLFNHHADGWAGSRAAGFGELREILRPYMGRGLFVVGDFNEQPDGPAVGGLFDTGLVDLGAELGIRTENRRRIDYLLADRSLAGLSSRVRVWPTEKSDHHAMLADLEW